MDTKTAAKHKGRKRFSAITEGPNTLTDRVHSTCDTATRLRATTLDSSALRPRLSVSKINQVLGSSAANFLLYCLFWLQSLKLTHFFESNHKKICDKEQINISLNSYLCTHGGQHQPSNREIKDVFRLEKSVEFGPDQVLELAFGLYSNISVLN